MPRRGGGDDGDRPKRSWREIDRNRGRSAHAGSSDRPQWQQDKLERSQSYRQYKANLDKFFDGASTPAGGTLKELLDPGGEKAAKSKVIEEIQKASASDRRKWAELVKAFVETSELPPDAYLLTEFLSHPKEAVAAKALARLAALHAEGAFKKVPASLEQQLRSLELTADDDELKVAAKALRERLRG